jgi:hypothetical protein
MDRYKDTIDKFLSGQEVVESEVRLDSDTTFTDFLYRDDIVVDDNIIGFTFIGSFHARARRIVDVDEDIDELILTLSNGSTKEIWRLSYPYDPEVFRNLEIWKSERYKGLEEDIKNMIAGFKRDLKIYAINGQMSWHAELDRNSQKMKTVGCMVLDRDQLYYITFDHCNRLEEKWNDDFSQSMDKGFTAQEIFNYWIERSNGITVSFSLPEPIEAIDDVDLRLKIAQTRKRKD